MSQADSLAWTEYAAGELDVGTLYDVLMLRSAVFIVEQNCVYLDPDGLDLLEGTRHVVGKEGTRNGAIAAYARILAPDVARATPRIGRVIVSGETRGRQLGRRLMERTLASCEQHWPGLAVELGAQAHLVGFYGSLGFQAMGEPYDEDGILHVWMRRETG